MKIESQWGCECQRYFVPTNKLNGKGNPITMPVEVRCLWISGKFLARKGDETVSTNMFKVNLVRRGGKNVYSIKFRMAPERWWHDKTPIHESEYRWVRQESMGRDEFLGWLRFKVGDPLAACVELETCPPDTQTSLSKAA